MTLGSEKAIETRFLCRSLTMLLRPHGASIDIHVWVDFDGGDFQAGGLEEQARGGG